MANEETKTVWFDEITVEDRDALTQFYKVYERSFPLEDEREPIEAFLYILKANEDKELQARFGPYREVLTAIRLAEASEIVGGLVFAVTTSQAHISSGYAASVQAIYFFLEERYRTLNPTPFIQYIEIRALEIASEQALEIASEQAGKQDGGLGEAPIFLEVNNPLRMEPEDREKDTDLMRLDPWRRYKFWLRLGAEPLAFEYVQPALSSHHKAVRYLDLFCFRPRKTNIPSAVLLRHLHAFISMSVLKGRDANADPAFVAMRSILEERAYVNFVPRDDPQLQKIEEAAEKKTQRIEEDEVEKKPVRDKVSPTLVEGGPYVKKLSFDLSDRSAYAKDNRQHLIMLIHGIRSWSPWYDEIHDELEKHGFRVAESSYGYLGLFRFLLPVAWFRRRAAQQVIDDIRDAKAAVKPQYISIIAHSFGTYIVSYLLSTEADLKFERLIFCGSVAPRRFRPAKYFEAFHEPLLNEVGTRDVWPVFAESITWGYGATGAVGFRRYPAFDRYHHGLRHSEFLGATFCHDFWVPFLRGEPPCRKDKPEPPKWWLSALLRFQVKYDVMFLTAAIALLIVARIYLGLSLDLALAAWLQW